MNDIVENFTDEEMKYGVDLISRWNKFVASKAPVSFASNSKYLNKLCRQ